MFIYPGVIPLIVQDLNPAKELLTVKLKRAEGVPFSDYHIASYRYITNQLSYFSKIIDTCCTILDIIYQRHKDILAHSMTLPLQ